MSTRTNIVLDDELVAQAMARAGVKTKKAAVEAALRAYVRKPDYSGLLAMEGSRLIADDYDPKALFTHPRYQEPMGAGEPAPPGPAVAQRRHQAAARTGKKGR
ncbi:MAG TPA: type II toxin-antitoxin system VapB family antitoxin [Ramlibacter sp.]|nr:type II toxin-antitoxin system VapB family antitoxin [Ramlibacter sp.]